MAIFAFPKVAERDAAIHSTGRVQTALKAVEWMVAIEAIGKCDLRPGLVDRSLTGMGQDTSRAHETDNGSGGDISGTARAAASTHRYSRVAIILHWTIAILVLSTIPLGLYGAIFDGDLARTAKDIHKPIGILILALTIVRVGWRLTHRPPPLPETMTPRLRRIARFAHIAFYGLLLLLPFSGWWMSSAVPERHPISFGAFDIPFLPVPRGFVSAGPAHLVHVVLGFTMIGLAALHIAAALKHHLVEQDDILSRMLPARR